MNNFIFIAVTAVIAIFIHLVFHNHEAITGKKIILGNPEYNIKPAVAPKLDGQLLKIFAYIATKTRFGPTIIRQLLNDNGIVNLRELASQISIPPLHYPMRRLSKSERVAYKERIDPSSKSVEEVIQSGISEGTLTLPSSHPLGLRSIEDYAALYRNNSILPSQIISKTLTSIKEWEKAGFRIFSEIHHDDVLQQAKASDARFKEGKALSIFDGVPIAFKDMMDIRDYHHYNGQNPAEMYSAYYWIAKEDDVQVARFRALGAIIMGSTIMTEGGVTPVGYNAHFRGPVSAYSWNRYSGGSSSGSAVAVATGLIPLAIGFDGGGSIRLPATMSGVHGLATGLGRCPFSHYYSSTMIKVGPLAATASDIALAYAVMSKDEPGHFYSQLYDGEAEGLPFPHLSGFSNIQDLSDLRIGIFPEWFNDSSSHVRSYLYSVIDFLKEKGVTFIDINIPHLEEIRFAHGTKIVAEFAMGFDLAHHDVNSGYGNYSLVSLSFFPYFVVFVFWVLLFRCSVLNQIQLLLLL
jgi:Asp-tRNA(Asn)/Glu-tRNA(Gln) amidotransferase A subunit family amidase